MKIRVRKIGAIFLSMLCLIFQGCIHEYPHIVQGNPPAIGKDPTVVNAIIEVTFEIEWQEILHSIEFSTRARKDNIHRFVIEILRQDSTVYHEEEFLNEEEFRNGSMHHKIVKSLEAKDYKVSVWYDHQDEEGNYPFDSSALNKILMQNFTTTDSEIFQCAFASDDLLLSEYEGREDTPVITKQMVLEHPGARFEIVATDVQKFITENKEALNQGDSFSVRLNFSGGAYSSFNLYTKDTVYLEEPLELSGRMRLPFAEYDELKIAEGFIFCHNEDEAVTKLRIINSSLATVSQTDYFSFPIKRGHITIIKGDFLTHPIDGIFSVDTVWEGEIEMEI